MAGRREHHRGVAGRTTKTGPATTPGRGRASSSVHSRPPPAKQWLFSTHCFAWRRAASQQRYQNGQNKKLPRRKAPKATFSTSDARSFFCPVSCLLSKRPMLGGVSSGDFRAAAVDAGLMSAFGVGVGLQAGAKEPTAISPARLHGAMMAS